MGKRGVRIALFLIIILNLPLIVSLSDDTNLINEKNIEVTKSSPIDCSNPLRIEGNSTEIISGIIELFNLSINNSIIEERLDNSNYIIPEKICDVEDFIETINKELSLNISQTKIEKISKLINNKIDAIKKDNTQYNDFIEIQSKNIYRGSSSFYEFAPFSESLVGSTLIVAIFSDWEGEKFSSSKVRDGLDKIDEMTSWIEEVAPPQADLSFEVVSYKTFSTTQPESYPGANLGIWGEEALSNIGFVDTNNDGWTENDAMNILRNRYNTKNVIFLYLTPMVGRSYAGGSSTNIFFYTGCSWFFCTEEDFTVYAHESLHLFGAGDEYYQEWDDTGCSLNDCDQLYSRWGYSNGNCERCNLDSTDCIMKYNSVILDNPYAICSYTKGQLGWRDQDSDGLLDSVDNCLYSYNPIQEDMDSDEIGDICDTDVDGDNVLNWDDLCSVIYGTYCNGCLKPTCQFSYDATCPSNSKPICVYNNSFSMKINSPINNSAYGDKKIYFNIQANKIIDQISYVELVNNKLKETVLCKNCNNYTGSRNFREGNISLNFVGVNKGLTKEQPIKFIVDSKSPRITLTLPKSNSFTNGSNFYLRYNEDNCKNITLRIFSSWDGFGKSYPCNSDGNIEKIIGVNLTKYNDQEISYNFKVTDIANNTAISRVLKLKVDTTPPIIKNPTSFWQQNGRYVNFNLEIDEKNFDSVEYLDSFDGSKARWITLCSRLKVGGVCSIKKSFRTGQHTLTLRVLDKAGNSETKSIGFGV